MTLTVVVVVDGVVVVLAVFVCGSVLKSHASVAAVSVHVEGSADSEAHQQQV